MGTDERDYLRSASFDNLQQFFQLLVPKSLHDRFETFLKQIGHRTLRNGQRITILQTIGNVQVHNSKLKESL